MFPSTSLSFESINPFALRTVNVVSSSVLPMSATAIGASFIGVTVMSKVLVSVNNPSETV